MPEEAAVASPTTQEVNVSALASKGPEPAGANFTESFAELEAAMGEPIKEAAKQSPPSKSAKAAEKPTEQKPDTNLKDSALKDSEKSADDAEKNGDGGKDGKENGKPLPAPELRKAYQELKTKHAQLQKEYETFKAAPREDPQVKTLAEKLQASEKHRQQLDEELKHTAYERSEEFKQRYHTPFVMAFERGQQIAAALKVTDAEGNVRQGTPEDFAALMQIPDEDAAIRWAEEQYGPARAALLMNQRNEVVKHAQSRMLALQEAQKTAGEREKMRTETDLAQRKALAEKWTKLNTDAATKWPHWFAEVEGDEKGNELLRKGYEMADAAFGNSNLSPEQLVELHSAIRNRAAGFGRVAHKARQLEARVKELEAKLAEYETSEPKSAEGKPGKSEPGELDWEKKLEAQWV